MRRAVGMVTLGVLLAAWLAFGGEVPVWRSAAPGYQWSFPRDVYAHPQYKTEWWYLTGHLTTEDGEALAFQLTFFRLGVQPGVSAAGDTTASAWRADDLIMAHAALTEPGRDRHVFSEVIWRTTPFLGGFGAVGDSTVAWCRAPAGTDDRWQLTYRDGTYRLRVNDRRQDLRFELKCTPGRGPVFHGRGGFSPKSGAGDTGSLYYSQPSLQVTGTVTRNGSDLAVTGTAWLDREIFTNTLGAGQKGWDWLALQLDDGRRVMLYRLLDQTGATDFALGTLIAPDGSTRSLPADSWQFTPGRIWTSPQTEAQYPITWRLKIPDAGIDLELQAVRPDQENVSPRTGIHYWEGAATATRPGSTEPVGRAFIELTGRGEGSRPPV